MKLKNPTTSDLTIQHKGVEFSLKAGEAKELPDETGHFWLGLHGFLQVVSEVSAPVEEVKEEAPILTEVKPKRGRKSNKQSK